ncbi:hypothetical protein [Streptomyces xiamenensis]|uniref:hypothetical protein n=1 Tax=Streptomyces xiamenensis TaxID=408015 RepID=UPI0037D40E90
MLRTTIAAVAGAATLALVGAAPAQADSPRTTVAVDVEYHCVEEPYGEADANFIITLTAPYHVRPGGSIHVDAKVTTHSPAPEGLPPNSLNGAIQVVAGGAGSGTVTAPGLTNPVVPPAGDPLTLSGARATFTADAKGLWTFRPGAFETVNAQNEHLVCTPRGTTQVAALTVVI